MQLRATLFVVTAATSIFASTLRASEFKENHLFVGCVNNHSIVEFDEDGEFVRTISPPGLNQPRSLAFGPNGRLYVTSFSTNEVFEILPSGATNRKFKMLGTVGPNALTFNARGTLYINGFQDRKIHEIDVLGPTPTEFGPISLPLSAGLVDIEMTASGSILGVSTDQNVVCEVNLLGQLVRFKTLESLTLPTSLAIGPFQQVWMGSFGKSGVVRATAFLAQLNTFPMTNASAPGGMTVGPNGELFVCSQNTNRIQRFNPRDFLQKGDIGVGVAALSGPVGIAFAPTRFEAEIEVRIAVDGESLKSIDEDVTIAISPGSRTILLQYEEGADGDGIAALFVQPGIAFHGSEVLDFGNKRLFEGTAWYDDGAEGSGSIELEVKGSTDGDFDFYKVSKASGRISRAGAGVSYFGSIKTKSKID